MEFKEIREYQTVNGKRPIRLWLEALKDGKGRAIIKIRILRLMKGIGETEFVGEGVWELKIHFGPGYRVYYAESGGQIILLLCGGDKSTQNKDIAQAHSFWADYKARKHETI